jgi:hypothetical protein
MKLSFKEFLKMSEGGTTTTACVAHVPTMLFAVQEIMHKKKKKHTSEGKEGMSVDDGYDDSPVLTDKDEFLGKDAAKQAKDCGLAMCPHQLGVGRMVSDKRTTNKRLRNVDDDLPIDNSKPKK